MSVSNPELKTGELESGTCSLGAWSVNVRELSVSYFAENAATRGDASQAVTCLTEPTDDTDDMFRLCAGGFEVVKSFGGRGGASARTGAGFFEGSAAADDSALTCLAWLFGKGTQEKDEVNLFMLTGRHASVGRGGRGPLGGGPSGGSVR
jgi:hypothetical protein